MGGVLSIGKLGVDQEQYYLNAVAAGVEDYYRGAGEASGRWLGSGAGRLGLAGEVASDDLQLLMAGSRPGEPLLVPGERKRTPGWDLTFSAPKSVSVLWALGGDRVAGQVVEAHEKAVAEALAYVEQRATWTRRRRDGAIVTEAGDGLVVAAFRHRMSRAGDPQLHTHCLAMNMTGRGGGGWGAIDSRHLYRHARTAGFVYQLVLRGELTARLGVEWGSVAKGVAEIAGVPRALCTRWSTRRAEIEGALDEKGHSSARAAQVATLSTRRAKAYDVDPDSLHGRWAAEAVDAGIDPRVMADVVGRQRHAEGVKTNSVIGALVDRDGLTRLESTFDERDVVRGWCERAPAGASATWADIEGWVARTVVDREVVAVRDRGPGAGQSWTTRELLDVERRLVDEALAAANRGKGVASRLDVAGELAARPTVTGEQKAMVRHLCGSGNGVDVVVGVAGAGKTFALDCARAGWEATGYRVIGTALAGKAARQLGDDAHIPAMTLDRLLLNLDDPRTGGLTPDMVIVVDEAGMAPTRKLGRLLDHARVAGAKVVLVGDPHQLPEVEAGGVLAGLAARLEHVELHENRRQVDPGERDALSELRAGDVAKAIRWYEQAGRLHVSGGADEAIAKMVDAWWDDRQAGRDSVLMAHRRADTRRLAGAARARLAAADELHGPTIDAAGVELQAGDDVLFLRNDRRIGVDNGDRGRITTVHRLRRTVDVELRRGPAVTVPAGYLDDGQLEWGYALTVHKNQGATVDSAHLFTGDSLHRELGYTGASRGRTDNRLYLTGAEDDDLDVDVHAAVETAAPVDPVAELGRSLEHSDAKQLALDQLDW